MNPPPWTIPMIRLIPAARLCAPVLLAILGLPAAASAHAFLETAVPAVGSTVRAAPTEVRINFTQGIEPAFTTIHVADAQGQRVDQGGVHIEDNNTHLAIGLKALTPGSYHVTWKAVSVDTHHTEGSFTFTVAP